MNLKNNVTPKERVKEMAKALSSRNKGYLIIECEFFKLMNFCGFNRLLTDLFGGKIQSRTTSAGALALVDLVSYFSKQDSSRFEKGIEFLNAKYPHAVFLFHEYVLGVANLTSEEIEDCLSQIGIGLGYFKTKPKGHEN